MKLAFFSLFAAIDGLAAAMPTAESDSDVVTLVALPGTACSHAGQVNCSNSNGSTYPHILVCVNRESGLKWFIQATCAAGTTYTLGKNNTAWCAAV